jgi:hypothetical protein
MMKSITLAAVAALTLAVTMSAQPANAGGNGGAVAAGVVGGLAVGAIVGSQVNRGYYNGGPGYYESGYQPVYGGGCHIERQQFEDRYGRIHSRRIRVCD